jgi:hypothetical protein
MHPLKWIAEVLTLSLLTIASHMPSATRIWVARVREDRAAARRVRRERAWPWHDD